MKTLIIYISTHSNTEKIAKTIAKVLDAELAKPNEANINKLSEYDLIGFGSGIFFWKHHKLLLDFVDSLEEVKNTKAFIFSTSGLPRIRPDFHRVLREKLRRKGFHILDEFSCKGWDTFSFLKIVGGINKSRPNNIDLGMAKLFAEDILKYWNDELTRLGKRREFVQRMQKARDARKIKNKSQ